MEHYAVFLTEYAPDGHAVGHDVQGNRVRASLLIPVGRWLWISMSGRSWWNMTAAEVEAAAREYAERRGY